MTELQIFIIGMTRSGTTLLSEIINSHSKIAVSTETHYFDRYWKNEKEITGNNLNDFLNRFMNGPEFPKFQFSKFEIIKIRDILFKIKDINHSEILNTILSVFLQKRNKEIWAEKTPGHLLYVPVICKLFPNSKFICIFRDPRDICLSLKKVPYHNGNPISVARRWKTYAALSNKYKSAYNKKYIEIKYEDLIISPNKVVMQLCNFLGINFEKDMLRYYMESTSTFDKTLEYWKLNAKKPIINENSGKWKKEMTQEELFVFQKYLRNELKLYNYQTRNTDTSIYTLYKVFQIFMRWFRICSINILRSPSSFIFSIRNSMIIKKM